MIPMNEGQRAELIGSATYYLNKAMNKLELTLGSGKIDQLVMDSIKQIITMNFQLGAHANKIMKEYKEKQKIA